MNTEKILALAAAQEEHMTAVRRELHKHPEMGWHEERTTDVIERELRAMGLTNIRRGFRGTNCGLICDIGEARPRIAIRADIDVKPWIRSLIKRAGTYAAHDIRADESAYPREKSDIAVAAERDVYRRIRKLAQAPAREPRDKVAHDCISGDYIPRHVRIPAEPHSEVSEIIL